MRTIYIDSEFRCHVTNDGTWSVIETDFFDGKCDAFVAGYRYVPENESWEREDGSVFEGEMITPWSDCEELSEHQEQYEQVCLELAKNYEMGVNSIA